MVQHLGRVAREARERAGLRQIDIATAAGVSHGTISNFEIGAFWPRRLDDIIDAYAAETGVDAREMWRSALERWEQAP